LEWAADAADALAAGRAAGSGTDWWPRFDTLADDLRTALATAERGPAGGDDRVAHRLARTLAALTYGRRFLREAVVRYEQAAGLAPTPGNAARDLADAAECALAFARAGRAYRLHLAAAGKARTAGDRNAEAVALSRAAVIAARHPGFGFEEL